MALADLLGDRLDPRPVADVADVMLRPDLVRDPAQPLLVPGEQDQLPALLCERARDRRADPARAAGDDRDSPIRPTANGCSSAAHDP